MTLDHVDMSGWDLVITNETGSPGETTEVLTLTADPIWSDLRAGTIITVSEQLTTTGSSASATSSIRWCSDPRARA